MKVSKEFGQQAMANALLNYIDEGVTLEDCSFDAFNSNYWIIGTYQAAEALADFDWEDQCYTTTMLNGVFGAIEYVHTYEREELGSMITDCSDPEKLANMVAYINGGELISTIMDEFDLDIDKELDEKQANGIAEFLENILKD